SLGEGLCDLLMEVVELGVPVEGVPDLLLPVELDERVAGLDGRARLDEPHDDERVVVLAGEPRGRDGRRLDRLDRARQPDAADEIGALDRHRARVGGRIGRTGLRAHVETAANDGGSAEHAGKGEGRRSGHESPISDGPSGPLVGRPSGYPKSLRCYGFSGFSGFSGFFGFSGFYGFFGFYLFFGFGGFFGSGGFWVRGSRFTRPEA